MMVLNIWSWVSLTMVFIMCLTLTFNDVTEANDAILIGTVYCDTCFHQHFSEYSHFIPGALVAVECGDDEIQAFREEVRTDVKGEFRVLLPFSATNHVDEIKRCSVKLITSSQPDCAVAAIPTATSSSIRVKVKTPEYHVFSSGFFAFQPLEQPKHCQWESHANINDEIVVSTPLPSPVVDEMLPPFPPLTDHISIRSELHYLADENNFRSFLPPLRVVSQPPPHFHIIPEVPPQSDTVLDTGSQPPPDSMFNTGFQPPRDSMFNTGSQPPPTDSMFNMGSQPPPADSMFNTGSQSPPPDSMFNTGSQPPHADSMVNSDFQPPPADSMFNTGSQSPPPDSMFNTGSQPPPPDSMFNMGSQPPPADSMFNTGSQPPPADSMFNTGSQPPPADSMFNTGSQPPPPDSMFNTGSQSPPPDSMFNPNPVQTPPESTFDQSQPSPPSPNLQLFTPPPSPLSPSLPSPPLDDLTQATPPRPVNPTFPAFPFEPSAGLPRMPPGTKKPPLLYK